MNNGAKAETQEGVELSPVLADRIFEFPVSTRAPRTCATMNNGAMVTTGFTNDVEGVQQ